MPTTPHPGDPTYESWLQMANSYGMTVDELYQAMVSYPAEQGAGYNYPQQPAAAPAAQPARATPQTGVGMYQGQRYDAGSPWNIPSAFAWGAEQFAANNIQTRVNWMQNDMDDAHRGLANAIAEGSAVEVDFFKKRVLQLRQDYQSVVQQAQTGATGYHAAQRAATTGMYLAGYEGLKGEVPQGFNIDIPLVLAEPPDAVEGYDETPTTPTTAAPKEGDFGTFGEVAPKAGDFGTFGKTGDFGAFGAPAPLSRGGQSYIPQGGLPQGGVAPYRGPGIPAAPEGGGGGGGAGIVETPGGRGFRSWQDLVFGMGDQWSPGYPLNEGEWPRGGTNLMRGTAEQLRGYLGDATPYRGGLSRQMVDLGQGEQLYDVRRDSMGNIRSYTPTRDSQRLNRLQRHRR